MPVTFACESCGQSLSVPEALAGRRGKCRGCGHEMTVPDPDSDRGGEPVEADGYALAESPVSEPVAQRSPPAESTFARATHEPSRAAPTPPPPLVSLPKLNRRQRAELRERLKRAGIGLAALALVLVLVALVVPKGLLVVGWSLAAVGIGVFGYGYVTTLYIAWTEDGMYAFLFLVFPPFALWYTVTRMEDLWHRLAIMAAGVAVLTLATWCLKGAAVEDGAGKPVGATTWQGAPPARFTMPSLLNPEFGQTAWKAVASRSRADFSRPTRC